MDWRTPLQDYVQLRNRLASEYAVESLSPLVADDGFLELEARRLARLRESQRESGLRPVRSETRLRVLGAEQREGKICAAIELTRQFQYDGAGRKYMEDRVERERVTLERAPSGGGWIVRRIETDARELDSSDMPPGPAAAKRDPWLEEPTAAMPNLWVPGTSAAPSAPWLADTSAQKSGPWADGMSAQQQDEWVDGSSAEQHPWAADTATVQSAPWLRPMQAGSSGDAAEYAGAAVPSGGPLLHPAVFQQPAEHPRAVGYNRERVRQYAHQWWNSYNPAYEKFEVDCSSYVCQCLFAGGAPMNYTGKRDSGWWYRGRIGGRELWSYSWAVANSLRLYLSSSRTGLRAVTVQSPAYLTIGDVISYSWKGDGNYSHSTIVTGMAPNGLPLVNAHTVNSRGRYWDYRDSYAYTDRTAYKFFHIVDAF